MEIPIAPRTKQFGTQRVASWRTEKPVLTNPEACNRCWLCVDYCPDGAVSKGEKLPEFEYDFCKGCGICTEECKFGAIRMLLEPGG